MKPVTVFGPDVPFAYDDWIIHPGRVRTFPYGCVRGPTTVSECAVRDACDPGYLVPQCTDARLTEIRRYDER
jgi:hypothetical protein